MGGKSSEREVSLVSGAEVISSLERLGLDCVKIDLASDLCAVVKEEMIDIAFIALHGKYGEDGCVQGALETMGIAYTGSGVKASAMAMSKITTKIIAKAIGVDTPEWQVVRKNTVDEDIAKLGLVAPVVVKPDSAGSSIGVSICHDDNDIETAIRGALDSDDTVIVEKFIEGALVTIGIVGQRVLPPVEIETGSGFYDFNHKYTPGDTVYHTPARLQQKTLDRMSGLTMKIHRELGCAGMSRSEFIVDKHGKPWFLELNTIPGLTESSLLPKAAAAAGMSFDDLVLVILGEAVDDE